MYRELDDNEILFMIEEDQNFYDVLLEKYKPLVIKLSKKYIKVGKKVGYELDDIIQVGNLGLLEALKHFNNNKKVLFYTFIYHCIENKIKVELRSQFALKRTILNQAISYDEIIKGTDKPLVDFLEDRKAVDPYDELLTKEIEEKYLLYIQSLPFEVAIAFEMKNEGFTNQEISMFLQMDIRTITRSIKFAKQKMCFN